MRLRFSTNTVTAMLSNVHGGNFTLTYSDIIPPGGKMAGGNLLDNHNVNVDDDEVVLSSLEAWDNQCMAVAVHKVPGTAWHTPVLAALHNTHHHSLSVCPFKNLCEARILV